MSKSSSFRREVHMHARCSPLSDLSLRCFFRLLLFVYYIIQRMFQVPMCANVAVKSSSPLETAGTTLASAGTSEPLRQTLSGFVCRRPRCGSQSLWAVTSTTNYLASSSTRVMRCEGCRWYAVLIFVQ